MSFSEICGGIDVTWEGSSAAIEVNGKTQLLILRAIVSAASSLVGP
jgi:hypothetical protein